MLFSKYLFFILSFIAIYAALKVLISKSPMHSVLYLTLALFAIAAAGVDPDDMAVATDQPGLHARHQPPRRRVEERGRRQQRMRRQDRSIIDRAQEGRL